MIPITSQIISIVWSINVQSAALVNSWSRYYFSSNIKCIVYYRNFIWGGAAFSYQNKIITEFQKQMAGFDTRLAEKKHCKIYYKTYLIYSKTMPNFGKEFLFYFLCTKFILYGFERNWYLGCKNFFFQQADFVLWF